MNTITWKGKVYDVYDMRQYLFEMDVDHDVDPIDAVEALDKLSEDEIVARFKREVLGG